jgi:hypothetical protein
VRLNLEARTIWLLITLGLSFSPCPLLSQGTRKTSASIPVQWGLDLSHEPRIGDTVSVIFTVTPSESVPEMKIWFDRLGGVKLVAGDTIVYSSASKNETKTFSIQVVCISPLVDLCVKAMGKAISENGESFPLRVGGRIKRRIKDDATGQSVTDSDKRELRPEYQYWPSTGEMTRDILPADARYTRKLMEDLKEKYPDLTDWDALYILHDLEVLFGRYGLSGEEAIEVALDAGRLTKEQGMDRNEALEMVVRRREAWRLWRFVIIMLAVVLEVLLLLFITQKVPLGRKKLREQG